MTTADMIKAALAFAVSLLTLALFSTDAWDKGERAVWRWLERRPVIGTPVAVALSAFLLFGVGYCAWIVWGALTNIAVIVGVL